MKRIIIAVTLLIAFMATARADIQDGVAAYERGDYATALREFRPLARQGQASAQGMLGIMYDEGKGVPQDYAEAAKWWRLAAEQGDANAQTLLGAMYFNGKGVSQDYVQAHMWFNLATQGNEAAKTVRERLAEIMTPADLSEAQRLAREWKPKKQ